MAVPWAAQHADALLWAGYGGEEAGAGVARVLYGRVNPSGKLPFTMYTSLDQLPPYESMQMDRAPGRTYRYLTETPLYRFGFGLSFTSFSYSTLQIHPTQQIEQCSSMKVSVKVTNTGNRAGEEVVQLYIRLKGTAATAPLVSLRGFEKISLQVGESTTVRFVLDPQSFAVVEPDNHTGWVLQPCSIVVEVAELSASVQMTGTQSVLLSSCSHSFPEAPPAPAQTTPSDSLIGDVSPVGRSVFVPAAAPFNGWPGNLSVSSLVLVGTVTEGIDHAVSLGGQSVLAQTATGLMLSSDGGKSYSKQAANAVLASELVSVSLFNSSYHGFGNSVPSDGSDQELVHMNKTRFFSLGKEGQFRTVVTNEGVTFRGLPSSACSLKLQYAQPVGCAH